MLSLAAALVLSQAVYTWTDEEGVVHYSDGASGLPEGAEKTEGGSLSVIPRDKQATLKPAEPAPRPSLPPSVEPAAAPAAPAPAPPSSDRPGFTHTTQWPGLEGLDVYYAHQPPPAYYPHRRFQRPLNARPAPAAPAAPPPQPPPAPKKRPGTSGAPR